MIKEPWATAVIKIPPAMRKEIDDLAKKENRKRAELVREALRRYMQAAREAEANDARPC